MSRRRVDIIYTKEFQHQLPSPQNVFSSRVAPLFRSCRHILAETESIRTYIRAISHFPLAPEIVRIFLDFGVRFSCANRDNADDLI